MFSVRRNVRNCKKLISERQRAEYFAELLNKIRNNLFHGDKVYDDANDRELIKHTVYILRDFVKLEIPG